MKESSMTQIIILWIFQILLLLLLLIVFSFNEFIEFFLADNFGDLVIFYNVLSGGFLLEINEHWQIRSTVAVCACVFYFFLVKIDLNGCDGSEMVTRTPDIKLWNDNR